MRFSSTCCLACCLCLIGLSTALPACARHHQRVLNYRTKGYVTASDLVKVTPATDSVAHAPKGATPSAVMQGHVTRAQAGQLGRHISSLIRAEFDGPIHGIASNAR
jgi:hypothetical protein